MTSIRQFANLISARRRRIAIAALPLAVLLVLGVLASQPAHAQTNFKVLYSFRGKPAGDGSLPHATLVRDSAGNLFGTTLLGGDTNNGTVFKLDSSGRETVLHRFAAGSNGAYPLANLVLDSAGNLYGTTARGAPSARARFSKWRPLAMRPCCTPLPGFQTARARMAAWRATPPATFTARLSWEAARTWGPCSRWTVTTMRRYSTVSRA